MQRITDEQIGEVILEADRRYYGTDPPVDRQRVTAQMYRYWCLLDAQCLEDERSNWEDRGPLANGHRGKLLKGEV